MSEAMQPLARTSAQGYTPLCAAGAGPYGNTGKHRAGPDPDRAERRLNPQTPKGFVHIAPATKGGMHFLARRAVVKFFATKGGIKMAPPKGRSPRQRARSANQ